MTTREALDNAARLAASPTGADDVPPAIEAEPAPPNLDPNAILIAEFEYARAAAFQANEDRARVSSYFLATGGSVVLALLGLKLDSPPHPLIVVGFASLFAALAWMGWNTLNQLAALRLAWRDSCLAMNQVKDHYVSAHSALQGAFRWTDQSLPPAFKPTSLSSQLARMVAAIMGLATAVAAACALWAIATMARVGMAPWAIVACAAALAAVVIRVSWLHYVNQLRPR
jgi:hypothetical protein